MGAAESSESEQDTLQEALRVKPPLTAEAAGNATQSAATQAQPKIQQPTPIKPNNQKPAATPASSVPVPALASAAAVATQPAAPVSVSAPALRPTSTPARGSASAPGAASTSAEVTVAPATAKPQSQPQFQAQTQAPTTQTQTAAPSTVARAAPIQTASTTPGSASSSSSPPSSNGFVPSAASSQSTSKSATPAAPATGTPAKASTVQSQSTLPQSVPSRPVSAANGSAPSSAPTPNPTTTTTKSAAVSASAASPQLGTGVAAASTSSSGVTVSNGVLADSSSEKVLADAEVAAMEEFILKEAKAHSAVYEHPLWYELVEWASKFMPSDIVLAYEHHIIAYQILSISKLEKFKKKLDELTLQRKNKKRQIAHINSQLKSANLPDSQRAKFTNELIELQSNNSSAGSDHQYEIPYEFARQLLELDKQLAVLRHDFVPGRISEEQFWFVFFDTLISSVQAHVISTQHKVKQQHINMQYFKHAK